MSKEVFPDDYYKYDVSNFKRYLKGFKDDIRKAYDYNPRNFLNDIDRKSIRRVLVCGMGGSGIAADLLGVYLDGEVEIITVRDYNLPSSATSNDLVIISSYSGNTEEAISCYRSARRTGCQTVFLSSGGKLQSTSESTNLPFIKMPEGYQPRCALPYSFFQTLRILEELALVKSKEKEVKSVIDYFNKNSLEKVGLDLSEKLDGKTPLIYTSLKYYPVAFRWKTQFNENAKTLAFANYLSEMNHNELHGFVNLNSNYHAIFLTFDDDFSRIKKRIDVSKQVITKHDVTATELDIKGSLLVKLMSSVLLGDWVSYYTALRLKTDPTPVDVIERFKKDLGPFV